MPHVPQVFTIRRRSDPTRLVAKFIASEPGDLSDEEKEQISSRLHFTLAPDFLFEPTSYGVKPNVIGREPDFRTPNGREFWPLPGTRTSPASLIQCTCRPWRPKDSFGMI
jgi:hypothetical protein